MGNDGHGIVKHLRIIWMLFLGSFRAAVNCHGTCRFFAPATLGLLYT